MRNPPLSYSFLAVAYLAAADGWGPSGPHGLIADAPGCWEYTVGQYQIALNGATEARASSFGASVGPICAVVYVGGAPALFLSPLGGLAMGGADADAFVAAVEAETKRLGGETASEAERREQTNQQETP